MRRPCITALALAALLAPLTASARSISELGAAYKWGMSSEEVLRMLTDEMQAKSNELVAHEPDANKQDQLRLRERDLEQQLRDSLVKFDGVSEASRSWSSSLVQEQFAQRNDESMLVVTEAKLRRFLFFWHDKLYKQVIAFEAAPGKSFDDFAHALQDRYGQAEMRFQPLRTNGDDMKLDHVEWPASADYQLFASDQTEMYDNYCLTLFNPGVSAQVETHRKARPATPRIGSALIDAVTTPSASATDRNEDVVDRIINRK